MPDYLDTSTFMKLVRSEEGSLALRDELATRGPLVSSVVLVVEGRRAAARYGALALTRARAALGTITLLAVDEATLESAATLEPPTLRSLDALHLAAAVSMADELGRFYCYDARLADAAAARGIEVRRPG